MVIFFLLHDEYAILLASGLLNKMKPKRHTPRHIIIGTVKVKHKERNLKAVREKQAITYKGDPIQQQQIFQQKTYRPEGRNMTYSKFWKEKKLLTNSFLPSKVIIQNSRRD